MLLHSYTTEAFFPYTLEFIIVKCSFRLLSTKFSFAVLIVEHGGSVEATATVCIFVNLRIFFMFICRFN